MPVTLELHPEVENSLAAQAAALGVSLQEYLHALLEERAAVPLIQPPGTDSHPQPTDPRYRYDGPFDPAVAAEDWEAAR